MKTFGDLFKKKTHISNISTPENLSKDINQYIEKIRNELGNSSDLSINLFKDNTNENLCYVSIYIENLVDKDTINSLSSEITNVLKAQDKLKDCTPEGYFNLFKNSLFGFRKLEEGTDFNVLISGLLSGKTIFSVDGYNKFFSIDTFSVEGRTVSEPTSQNVIRGPKECFVENINVNVSLIRNKIKNKSLRVEELSKGNISKTKIIIMYFDKIAKKEIVDEIRRRLNSINIDAFLDSSYIEELIKDDRYSIFPQFLSSEKPDAVSAALLEGRVAIFVDGTAYVLTAPALFTDFLQSSEDYYYPYLVASVIRTIRYIAFFLTLIVPAGYIALATFHQEMIPTQLLISIAAQREGVPFPAFVEALFMEITFEILREAGVRMPRVIGPAISIVGALVLGQAAVEAGLISAVIVIIVSITAISSFALPNYTMSNSIRIIRFALMILSAIFGLYGVFMGLIILILHLSKLKSVGVPYLAPIATTTKNGIKDTIFRYPIWNNKYRPVESSNDQSPRVDPKNPVTSDQKEEPEFR